VTASASFATAVEQVAVAALESTKRDRSRDVITAEQERFILDTIREHANQFAEAADETPAAEPNGKPVVFCYGIRDPEDEMAAEMLEVVMRSCPCRLRVLSRDRLVSEVVDDLRESAAVGLCLIGLPPGGLSQIRSLCKRFRAAVPDLSIAVGRWGTALPDKHVANLRDSGATYVGWTLADTREHVLSMARLRLSATESAPAATERTPVSA
jgi:hypothetical protein